MKNFYEFIIMFIILLYVYKQNENDKVSFADYTDWDMEDRDHLGEEITKLDSLNGDIQTARVKVKLQYENVMNIIDQYLAELRHKYKQKEIDQIKDHFGFEIGGDNVMEKRNELKNKLKDKLRNLIGQNEQKLPQKQDINSQIEEYSQKTQDAQQEIDKLQQQIDDALNQRKQKANKLKQDRLDHFDKLRKIRDSEAIASDQLKDIMKTQKHMMGGDLTQKEFVNNKRPTLLRKGKPWVHDKIGLKQRAEIYDFQQKFKRRNQKYTKGLQFGQTQKQKVLKQIHDQVKDSVRKAFKNFKNNFIL